MHAWVWGLSLASALAVPAAAQVIDGGAARKLMFPLSGYEILYAEGLSESNKRILQMVVPMMAEQLRQPVRYYGAIAWSPDDGLAHESVQAAMDYHSPEAAGAAARAACDKLRSGKAKTPCQVAASMVPKRYRARPLTLSLDATAGFDRQYLTMKGHKALAISPTTGAWGLGDNDAAAVAACRRSESGGKDCAVVIRD